jgi:hypothetical protein
MLLKMAFIKEGLEDYTEALIYLDYYSKVTSDEKAITKMAELAELYDLKGYTTGDFDFFVSLYNRHKLKLLAGLLLISIVFFVLILRNKMRNEPASGYGIAFVLFLSLLFAVSNFSPKGKRGIISERNSYLMSAPSAGSKMIAIIDKGHKVPIIESGEIWTEIEWMDRNLFVRSSNIEPLL